MIKNIIKNYSGNSFRNAFVVDCFRNSSDNFVRNLSGNFLRNVSGDSLNHLSDNYLRKSSVICLGIYSAYYLGNCNFFINSKAFFSSTEFILIICWGIPLALLKKTWNFWRNSIENLFRPSSFRKCRYMLQFYQNFIVNVELIVRTLDTWK